MTHRPVPLIARWHRLSVLALTCALTAPLLTGSAIPAFAQTDDPVLHSGGKQGSGGHEDGHDDDGHDDGHDEGGKGPGGSGGGHDEGGSGEGPKGSGLDGKGQGAGSGASGRPVWAQEGIPEVELGRLNVARAPDAVIDRAFAEALGTFTEEVAVFYRLDLDAMVEELGTNWDNVRLIDSPLQNIALFRDALDGTSILRNAGITTDTDTLLAAFLGTASDKAIPVTTETAEALSAILGLPLTEARAAAIAAQAERIRAAIALGHG